MVSEHASPLAVLGGVDAGGQNVHVAALASEMARRGAEVVVHTRRDARDLPQRVRLAAGVSVDHVSAGPPTAVSKDELLPYMDAFADRLTELWSAERPDVVHSHFWMSAYAALKAAERVGVPVVHTFHALGVVKRRYQGDRDTSPAGRLDIERDVVRRVDQIVATCTDEVFELLRLGADGERLTVIPCGVDLALFGPAGPSEQRRPGRRRLVTVGRLVERKGIGNVIAALAHVPGVELVVAGGPDRDRLADDADVRRLRDIAEQAGVLDRVDLRGRVERPDLPALLRSADAVVCAPWYEPFGIVPLEAMACGVPVVASAVGGLIDTVVDEQTGVHVPPRDPERLAQALAELLGDDERRRELGRAGVERTRRLYSWQRIAASTLDVYAQVARRFRSARGGRPGRRFELSPSGREHVAALSGALPELERHAGRLSDWGERLAHTLLAGGRLLAVGDALGAEHARHLATELVRRGGGEGRPLGALCLGSDGSALAALLDRDGSADRVLERELRAQARAGDVLLAVCGSDRCGAVAAAVGAAREIGVETLALTGAAADPPAVGAAETVAISAPSETTLSELQLVAVHVLCAAIKREVALTPSIAGAHGVPR